MTVSERQLSVVYCDDVRHEVSGKTSLIGTYSTEMIVKEFPFVISKLFICATFQTSLSNPPKSLKLVVYNGDEEIAGLVLAEENIQSMHEACKAPQKNGDSMLALQFVIGLANTEVSEETLIRVHAVTESETVKGRALRIRQAEPSETSRFGSLLI